MPPRTAKQCRLRYCNYLAPGILTSAWSQEEDDKLLAGMQAHGSSWALIASTLSGRTPDAVRNRGKFLQSRGRLRPGVLNAVHADTDAPPLVGTPAVVAAPVVALAASAAGGEADRA